MRARILACMGALLSLLMLIGCAPRPLEDQAAWEESVTAAAATVPGLVSVTASYEVTGGLSEMREMVVTATVEATSTTELPAVADAIEKAVAPAVVNLPVRDAALHLYVSGQAATGSVGRPTLRRSILLDELAAKYGLERNLR